jgi:hypothetical protein
LIYETDLTAREVKVWLGLPPARKLDVLYRRKFAKTGWMFGKSVIKVIHCSPCPIIKAQAELALSNPSRL